MRKVEQIVLRQRILGKVKYPEYLVIKTVNRLNPQIGEILSVEWVRNFMVNTKVSVTIFP